MLLGMFSRKTPIDTCMQALNPLFHLNVCREATEVPPILNATVDLGTAVVETCHSVQNGGTLVNWQTLVNREVGVSLEVCQLS